MQSSDDSPASFTSARRSLSDSVATFSACSCSGSSAIVASSWRQERGGHVRTTQRRDEPQAGLVLSVFSSAPCWQTRRARVRESAPRARRWAKGSSSARPLPQQLRRKRQAPCSQRSAPSPMRFQRSVHFQRSALNPPARQHGQRVASRPHRRRKRRRRACREHRRRPRLMGPCTWSWVLRRRGQTV